MKNKPLILALTLSATLMAFCGCKKEEPSVPPPIKDTSGSAADALKSASESVQAGAEKAVEKVKEGAETVKEGAEKAVDKVKEETKSLVDSATPDKAQSVIDKAQSLYNAGKYQEALTA